MPSSEPAEQRERDARRAAPNAAAAIAATSSVVKLTSRATCANSGASSTPASPAIRLDSIHDDVLDAVGVDAGELGHARALDHRPHPQAERGVPEQQREPDERDDRDR